MLALVLLFVPMDLYRRLLILLCFLLQRPEVTMYLVVYVDEIILGSSFVPAVVRLVSALGGDFAVKDLGKLHFFLGLEVTYCDAGLDSYSAEIFPRVVMLCWHAQVQDCYNSYVCY
jgi:hypothetical protein